MDWVKLLTDLEGHPKVLAVGNAGAGVYVRSLAYCGKYETDGSVPKEWAEQAVAREGQHEIPEHLVAAGLWEESDTGFEIRDFTEVNRSHEEMQALRETRSAAGKTGGKAKGKAKRKQTRGKSHSNSSSNSSALEVERDAEWDEWLTHFRATTERSAVEGSAEARGFFNARRDEGVSLADLKLATVGCHGDPYLRERKLNRPETILRASKFRRYIDLAKEAETPAPVIDLAVARTGLPALEKAWREALPRLEGSVPDSTFNLWLRPLVPIGIIDGKAVLGAPDGIRSWVERRYTVLILEANGDGYSGVELAAVPDAGSAAAA